MSALSHTHAVVRTSINELVAGSALWLWRAHLRSTFHNVVYLLLWESQNIFIYRWKDQAFLFTCGKIRQFLALFEKKLQNCTSPLERHEW